MRRLLVLSVILAVLGVCAPSHGYILVYRMNSTVKVVDTDANSISNIKVKSYLVMDLNEVEGLVGAQMVLYGKNGDASKIYYIDDLQQESDAEWTEEGDYWTVYLWDHDSPFEYDLILTGKNIDKDVGFGSEDKKSVTNRLKGTMVVFSGILFDGNQVLFGSGVASMSLDNRLTRAANGADSTVEEVITEIENGLIGLGYTELTLR